jgi:tetratricopeptide (TPR) repeat protein
MTRRLPRPNDAVALDPNLAAGLLLLGLGLHYAGRSAVAFAPLERAMRLDPHHPETALYFVAQAHFAHRPIRTSGGPPEGASRPTLRPATSLHVLLAACYGHLGRSAEAQAAWRAALRANPDYSFEHRRKILPYKHPADLERMASGLRAAGVAGTGRRGRPPSPSPRMDSPAKAWAPLAIGDRKPIRSTVSTRAPKRANNARARLVIAQAPHNP